MNDKPEMQTRFLAHIADDGRMQTVGEHLERTASLSSDFASAFGAGPQGRLIGLAHDIGKCSDAFQNRLQGGSIVDHASAGALECAKQNHLWAACCVAGHHGGLPDVGNQKNDSENEPTLYGRLRKALSGGIPPYQLPTALPLTPAPEGFGMDRLRDSFWIRMLFSCLVDADYLDTEAFMSGNTVKRSTSDPIPVLLQCLSKHLEKWQNPSNDLNRLRCRILNACIRCAVLDRGIYTLTVPTGGGKTVASMAFALHHAAKQGMDRVIYVIPYTSIIEQNAAVFREIFGSQNVLEHHSDASYSVGDCGSTEQYGNMNAIENWDAPIVITTAVQFFESLYANKPSKCRKLHSIANSVVIFDEAQMLPTEHLRPCVAAIAALVTQFRSTAVLCTATQPMLNDLFAQYAPRVAIAELAPEPDTLFPLFRRVVFDRAGTLTVDELSGRLSSLSQVLCIVNSRKAAQAVFRSLPADGSYHLSTLMYPAHRRSILAEIRRRLKEGLPCRVVSTSLIEAGVDVDFPAVYRELAGLDSVLQAAGRCNREGNHAPEDSVVTIFDGVSTPPAILRVNIGAAKEALTDGIDPAAPETIEHYFRSYRSLMQNTPLDKYGVVQHLKDGRSGCIFPFHTVGEQFHLIADASKTVYIPVGDGADLVRYLRNGERSRDLFRKLGQYGVGVYDNQYQALLRRGCLEIVDDNSAILLDLTLYVQKTGLNVCYAEEATGFLSI